MEYILILVVIVLLVKIVKFVFSGGGGDNIRRVDGGWIVDPVGRDDPYFVREKDDDIDDDLDDADDIKEEEEDEDGEDGKMTFIVVVQHDSAEGSNALQLKIRDELLMKYDDTSSIDNRDTFVYSAADGSFIGKPAFGTANPNFLDYLHKKYGCSPKAYVSSITDFSTMTESSNKQHNEVWVHCKLSCYYNGN